MNLSQVTAYYFEDEAGAADVGWLVAILLRFEEASLLIEVDPNTDEAVLRVELRPELQHWRDDCARRDLTVDARWSALVGSESPWQWQLTNQRGYRDGAQVELSSGDHKVTRQWVAAASRLYEVAVETAV